MRTALITMVLACLAPGAFARPVTMQVSPPHTPSVLYGPADMLCDLNKCRLFNLPAEVVPEPGTIVEFGLPALSGQDRVDMRRCFQVCRASVLGYESTSTNIPEHSRPTLFITPVEMRLE